MKSKLRLDLDSLNVIQAIVQQGSFAKAAAALHRVPSTISYTVSKLESALNIQIFERYGHKVRLTEAGAELHRYGSELLRVAYETESALSRISTGWEPELRLVVHDFFPEDKVIKLVKEFYQAAPNTRLSVKCEVLTGAWDALLSDRADMILAIGIDAPEVGGFSTIAVGECEFAFAVSPNHPLADHPEPIPEDEIRKYRAVAVADTALELPTKSVSLLPGQPVLTVSTPSLKIEAHLQGLGVGTLPKYNIRHHLAAGNLVEKRIESGTSWHYPVVYAWKNKRKGKALAWLRKRLCDRSAPIHWFSD